MKKYVLSLTLLAVFLAAGCQQAGDDPNALSGLVSSDGVKAESLFPQDTFLVMKFGTDDAEQQESLRQLAEYFPHDAWDTLLQELSQDFNDDFASMDVTFEDDLLPAVGDSPQVMMSFSGIESEDEEPDILMALSLADTSVFVDWMETSVSEGNGQTQSYKSYRIFSPPEKESYIAQYKDFLLVSNRIVQVQQALDRAESGGRSLLSNTSYQRGLATMPNALGYFYLDPRFSLQIIENDPEASEELGDITAMKEILEAIEGEFFAFSAEPQGIRIAGSIYGDAQKWEELSDTANFDIDPIYLYEQLPGEGVLLYAESSDLQKNFRTLMKMYSGMEGFDEGMEMFRSGLASQGIDFDEDVLAFMDRGYAFALYDLGTLVPSFGFFIDANSSPEGAEKVMTQLYAGMDAVLQDTPPELEGALTHQQTGGDSALVLDLSQLPEQQAQAIPPDFQGMKLEFHYGLNDQNLAYFAFYPAFEESAYTPLSQNSRFQEDLRFIEGFERGVSYIDIARTMAYVDRVVDFGARTEGGSADDISEYQLVKQYAAPFRSLVLGSGPAQAGEVRMQGFLRIGEL